jgi:gliding motility-associated-like protein
MLIKRFLLFVLGLLILDNLFAQLCQGSLGDPVVHIDFGSGLNTGQALSSSITTYNYFSGNCPDDGYYTLANSANNCFNNTWHTISEDHTNGDNNGYMMLVNASFTAGDFYVQEVKGLCGGTTYEFAAWLINVLKPSSCGGNGIRPNISFNIETTTGQILQTYSTGNIDATIFPAWKQYGLFFSTPPATTSVIVRITNNAPGGCGNDLALDDITFRPCGPRLSININGVATDIKNLCTGDTATLHFKSTIVGGYINSFYQWQKSNDSIHWTDIPGATFASYTMPPIITPGKYFYRLAVAEGNNISISSCRIASAIVAINANPLPMPAATNNGPGCEGSTIMLNATGGVSYEWTGPGNFSSKVQSPVIINVSVNNSGKYYVKVTTEAGCINNDSNIVIIDLNPVADAGNTVTICEGAGTRLQGNSINATSFKWSPVKGLSDSLSLSPLATPAKTTTYILTLSNGVCKDSAFVLVNVLKKPFADAGPDMVIIGNQVATLDGQVAGSNFIYFWTPGLYISSDTALKPQVSPPYDANYTLHVISMDGCGEATDNVAVKYYEEIYIPTAFTPNNDGLNDHWNIPALHALTTAEVSVFNRYGQLIFYNRGNTKQWDGSFKNKPQPSGVYVYLIDLKNGLNKLHGTITLIR